MPSLAQRIKQGYERRLIAGPAPDPQAFDARHQSATSVTSYVYVSVPVVSGQTGVRGICGDHTGRLCITSSPEMLRDLDGSGCPAEPECTPF